MELITIITNSIIYTQTNPSGIYVKEKYRNKPIKAQVQLITIITFTATKPKASLQLHFRQYHLGLNNMATTHT